MTLKPIWSILTVTRCGNAVIPSIAAASGFGLLTIHSDGTMHGLAMAASAFWSLCAFMDFGRGAFEYREIETDKRFTAAGLIRVKAPKVRIWDPSRSDWVEHELDPTELMEKRGEL